MLVGSETGATSGPASVEPTGKFYRITALIAATGERHKRARKLLHLMPGESRQIALFRQAHDPRGVNGDARRDSPLNKCSIFALSSLQNAMQDRRRSIPSNFKRGIPKQDDQWRRRRHGRGRPLVVRVSSEMLHFRNSCAFMPGGYPAGSCNEMNKITRLLARREFLILREIRCQKFPRGRPRLSSDCRQRERKSRTFGAPGGGILMGDGGSLIL